MDAGGARKHSTLTRQISLRALTRAGVVFCVLAAMSAWLGARVTAEESVDPETFVERRDPLLSTAHQGLLELARKIHKDQNFRERDRVAERLLRYFPDDKQVRSWLKYKRDHKRATWVRRKYKRPNNYKPKLLEKIPGYKQEMLGEALAALWKLYSGAADEVPLKLTQGLLDELINLDPSDERFRKANGEVLAKKPGVGEEPEWILQETKTALRRRQELADVSALVKEKAPEPTASKITDRDLALGVTWSQGVKTPLVRVLTAAGYSETIDVARACHASVGMFKESFGTKTEMLNPYTVCMLAFAGQKRRVIQKMQASAAHKRYLLTRVSGFHVPGTPYLIQAEGTSFEWKKDAAVRTHFQHLCVRQFGGNLRNPPGLLEGMGLYLTYKLIGTRLTVHVKEERSRYGKKKDLPNVPKLEDSSADWVYIGNKWDEAGRLPRLVESLALGLNDLGKEDLLLTYCLARYLLEGRPKEAVAFLRTVGSRGTSRGEVGVQGLDEAAIKALGFNLLDLDRRLRRWMAEMAASAGD